MLAVLEGLATIAVVVAVGYLLGRSKVLPDTAPVVLSRLVFFVATPCLLLQTLSRAPLSVVLSGALPVTAIATSTCGLLFVLIARLWWKRPLATVVIGGLASSYVNAGNLGIPLAVFVLGDAAYVAPVMLFQLTVLAPVAMVFLDISETGHRPSWRRVLAQPVRNPIILGSATGIVLALTGTTIPEIVAAPLGLIAGLAVPAALIAYGISLHGAPMPGRGGNRRELVLVVALKLVVLPVLAYLLARFVFGLTGVALLGATLGGALPTAQNVFTYAVRYRAAVPLARDAVSLTTLSAIPVLVVIATLLG